MEPANPNIGLFHAISNPRGFENLFFSQPSSGYLSIDRAVGFYDLPFALQNPAESVANCIALNSQDWPAAKKNMPASVLWQATRGFAAYHLQEGKPFIAIYSGRDPDLNLVLSHPELMGRTVPLKEVKGVLDWAGKHDALVEPVGRLECSVQEDADGRTPFGMQRINQVLFRMGEGPEHMAEGYALVRREFGQSIGVTYTISDFERAGVRSTNAALRWVGLGFDFAGSNVYAGYYVNAGSGINIGRAAGVAFGTEIFHRK